MRRCRIDLYIRRAQPGQDPQELGERGLGTFRVQKIQQTCPRKGGVERPCVERQVGNVGVDDFAALDQVAGKMQVSEQNSDARDMCARLPVLIKPSTCAALFATKTAEQE